MIFERFAGGEENFCGKENTRLKWKVENISITLFVLVVLNESYFSRGI
jgi:hypothetical protein